MNNKIPGWENRPQEIKYAEEHLQKTVIDINEEFKRFKKHVNFKITRSLRKLRLSLSF